MELLSFKDALLSAEQERHARSLAYVVLNLTPEDMAVTARASQLWREAIGEWVITGKRPDRSQWAEDYIESDTGKPSAVVLPFKKLA